MTLMLPRLLTTGAIAFLLIGLLSRGDDAARTGPATEKRFPPLKVPPGFKATLFACDPLIEYPSVIARGPRPGAVYVGTDYMTGLGTEIVRRSEVRLVEDSDGDGYADKSTVYAKGFNSIQGLAYHEGTVYVMHAPFLTALRDTKGTGVADERRDLLTGLGLTPEENPVRLHCANGVVVGHDGWLYLALGDNGVKVARPEGDRLVLEGGGILRCRPDGHDLHVFARGLRNIYDIALDADLNVFVRDNENDGGTYKIRVCHSFHGADHGYPYLYYEHPDEALAPLADLGLGSSAGGVCYLERQFPPLYRGNLFFCEWGRSVVRYALKPAGSGFGPVEEVEFAAGADTDPYGFKPTDIVVQRDGSMLVSDWCDGQRPRRGRGRIYHIVHVGDKEAPARPAQVTPRSPLERLNSESYFERCEAQAEIERRGEQGRKDLSEALKQGQVGVRGRLHAVWLLAHAGAQAELFRLAESDAEPRVRAQALRALADLVDPVLTKHRLDSGAGDGELVSRVAALAKGQDPRVLREVVIALGRLRWAGAPEWLQQQLTKPDAALAHAAMQTLRQSRNWSAILKLLDGPEPMRAIALRALAERAEPAVVDGLIERQRGEQDAGRRRQFAETLSRVYKKPGAWTYWGYRPPPRPANTVAWERTEAIAAALDRALADADVAVRLAVLQCQQRAKVPVRLETLGPWLKEERQQERVAVLLEALREQPVKESRPYLEAVIREKSHNDTNRLTALGIFVRGLESRGGEVLLPLAGALEDGPVLAEALRHTGKLAKVAGATLLQGKLTSSVPEVRAAAVEVLAELKVADAADSVRRLLDDSDARVRRAAAQAAGRLNLRQASNQLLKLASDPDAAVRGASLDALRLLREPRVIPLAVTALTDRQTELKALECLGELGGPEQAAAVADLAKHSPSNEVLAAAVRVLNTWQSKKELPAAQRQEIGQALAQVHGATGVLGRWQVQGPMPAAKAEPLLKQFLQSVKSDDPPDSADAGWRVVFSTGLEARVNLGGGADATKDGVWLARTDVFVPEATAVQLLASSSGTLRVWLNGKLLHQRQRVETFQLDADKFASNLDKGPNRLVVEIASLQAPRVFQLRFRRQSASAEHEKLMQKGLTRGNAERGRKLFLEVEKSLCLKCHRLGDQGERVGPELTGIGSRFSRVYILESILEPSRTIAPSFGSVTVVLKNGKVLSGIKVAETPAQLTLVDNQAQKHVLAKSDIDEQQAQPLSTMPDGLEKRFTPDEFVDLIEFLVSQKENRAPR